MLEIAEVIHDDIVYDLGCGDGRILFMVVKSLEQKRQLDIRLMKIGIKAF